MGKLLAFLGSFSKSAPSPSAPAGGTVSGPVKPSVGQIGGKQMLGGLLFVGFLFWMVKQPSAPLTQEQGKSSPTSVSVVSPDKNLFSSARVLSKKIDDDLNRENARLKDAQAQLELMQQQRQVQSGEGAPAQNPARDMALDRAEKEKERLWKARFSPGVLEVAGASVPAVGTLVSPQPVPAAGGAASVVADGLSTPAAVLAKIDANRSDCLDKTESGERLYAICEGTPITAISQFRLNGDAVGPVKALLDKDVYSRDRQHILFPKGTEVIGQAAKVEQNYQPRLNVTFHRVLFPDGRGYRLAGAPALEPSGEVAIRDKVNRHLVSTFSGAMVLGALAGFSQAGTGSLLTNDGIGVYRQGVGSQIGQTGQQMVERQMNRPYTLMIREGHPLIIFLNHDLYVPEYAVPGVVTEFGGKR